MGKLRGFRMKKHLIGFTRWVFLRPGRTRPAYHRLDQPETPSTKPFSRLLSWGRRLTCRTRSLCSAASKCQGSGYLPVAKVPRMDKPASVPKGHLAVYIGQKDGELRRVLVPVIYFNHPLFVELLREAEEEYGFNQQGGLTIPCGISEFERVQTRIASAGCGGRRRLWKPRR